MQRHLGNPWGVENGVEHRVMMEVGNRLGVLRSQQTREEAVRKMGLGGRLPEQSLNGTPSFSCHPGTMSPSGRDSRGLWAGTACALNAAH